VPIRQSFEAEWPPVARRLQIALQHRKVPRAMTEDLVQETGLRLFVIWDRVDPDRDIWPLALTIALNVLRDHIRMQTRRNQIAIPDAQIDHDTEVIALARVELEQVHAALDQLTAGQRSALLAEIGAAEQPDESASSLKMLRLRARKRLRTLIDDASAGVAAFELALQRLWRSAPATPLAEQFAPAVSVAAGLLCAVTLGGVGPTTGNHAHANPATGASSSGGAVADSVGWLDQSISLSIGRGSSSLLHDMSHFVSAKVSAADGESARRAQEMQKRHVTIGPEDTDRRNKKPKAGPKEDGVRVHSPRAEVGPDGYRVSGGGVARVGGQRVGAIVDAASGDGGNGLTSHSLPGPGVPDATAKVDIKGVGGVEYSTTGERATGTSPSAPLKETETSD
jgi:DNA-directed RNA polymerase specialized sigma24 family protein